MIGMGLIKSRANIMKLMNGAGNEGLEKLNVTIVDFVKIFKTNPFVERTVESMRSIIKR